VNLQAPRLTITPSTPADLADFITLEQDAEAMRYLNGGVPVDRATVKNPDEFAMPTGTEPEVFTIRLRDSGDFVGWIGF
jgi:hypothetical protein